MDMKKNYQKPEAEKIVLETEEPITASLNVVSNIFRNVAAEDEDDTLINL